MLVSVRNKKKHYKFNMVAATNMAESRRPALMDCSLCPNKLWVRCQTLTLLQLDVGT